MSGESIETAISKWLTDRRDERLLRRFGGIQRCPWCRQIAQSQGGWSFKAWERDEMLDVLSCGVCRGKSLWRFELLMIYIGPLEPPAPVTPAWTGYDISAAKLK